MLRHVTTGRRLGSRSLAVLAATAVLLVACGGDDGDPQSSTSTTSTSSTLAAAADAARSEETVRALADDAMEGRDNQTPGSARAQDFLVDALGEFAEPVGDDFRHPFAAGTNILGMVPGGDRPDEYVLLGAHYDHLGHDCRDDDDGDDICNGATDNAAGVATVLEIGRRLAAGDRPSRSVILAFWDAEEDGLLGSAAYVTDPPVPLDRTTAYVNWDIQGLNLLPSLQDVTILVGAETGGPAMVDALRSATSTSDLDTVPLSLLFGQGRSDHAAFAGAGVPTAFFSDVTSGCYHTVKDDVAAVDVDKLGREVDLGEAVARRLSTMDDVPSFAAGLPLATFDDARSILRLLDRAEPDFGRYSADDQAAAKAFQAELRSAVDEGAAAFDDDDVATLLQGSVMLVDLLDDGECDPFLD